MQRAVREIMLTHARACTPVAAPAAAAAATSAGASSSSSSTPLAVAGPPSKTKWSATAPEEWAKRVEADARAGGRFADETSASMLADLVEATREKRRLTIDWRGAAMTPEELIQATAKRVGLVPPELGRGGGGR